METQPERYNGHHCYKCWNVALWIGSDEGLYSLTVDCRKGLSRQQAAETMLYLLHGSGIFKTPDGAKYTVNRIRKAMKGLS